MGSACPQRQANVVDFALNGFISVAGHYMILLRLAGVNSERSSNCTFFSSFFFFFFLHVAAFFFISVKLKKKKKSLPRLASVNSKARRN